MAQRSSIVQPLTTRHIQVRSSENERDHEYLVYCHLSSFYCTKWHILCHIPFYAGSLISITHPTHREIIPSTPPSPRVDGETASSRDAAAASPSPAPPRCPRRTPTSAVPRGCPAGASVRAARRRARPPADPSRPSPNGGAAGGSPHSAHLRCRASVSIAAHSACLSREYRSADESQHPPGAVSLREHVPPGTAVGDPDGPTRAAVAVRS